MLELVKGIRPAWLNPTLCRVGIVVTNLPFAPSDPLVVEVGNPEQLTRIAYLSGRRVISSGPEPQRPNITYVGFPAEQMPAQIQQAEAGEIKFPNCLYFPSEGRELQPKGRGQVIGKKDGYRWVYRFSDSNKWAGSLESFLVAMDYRDLMAQREGRSDAGEFQQFLEVINRFLEGRQIAGVDRNTFRIQVKADGRKLSVDELSSGEKQILLILGEIQRRIRYGSVVLIDEPEIHLHPRWQRLLVRALTDLCQQYDAQLIITTHSEEVANAVYGHELILLDAVFAGEPVP